MYKIFIKNSFKEKFQTKIIKISIKLRIDEVTENLLPNSDQCFVEFYNKSLMPHFIM